MSALPSDSWEAAGLCGGHPKGVVLPLELWREGAGSHAPPGHHGPRCELAAPGCLEECRAVPSWGSLGLAGVTLCGFGEQCRWLPPLPRGLFDGGGGRWGLS